ncbi:MAG: hypothetical protein P1Q69_03885 [Candidatus Thorarchaeota archaeon]|nr:hypothetical protein [Candidatus Thorarchaeota archaeon]
MTTIMSEERLLDNVFVWGVRDRTGYWRFYYTEERADIASASCSAKRFTFMEAYDIHNGQRERMFSLPPVSLGKFERIIEDITESFIHRFFQSGA